MAPLTDVLVVDDDPGTRETLVDILEMARYGARAVGTAAEALVARSTDIPALAIVDYRLPDGNGLDLASRLRDADPDLAIIVLTANASFETAAAAVGQADDYLTKPVDPERLLRAVGKALERRTLVEENRALIGRLQQANTTLEARIRDRTEALQADRERLAEAQRIARIGSWEWDLLTGRLSCSPELIRLHGLEDEVSLTNYQWLFRHVSAEESVMVAAAVKRAMTFGDPFAFEVGIAPPGLPARWVAVQGRTETGPDGTPSRIVATSQDVTERKENQAALVHAVLHDALTGLPNRVLLLDRLQQALTSTPGSGGVAVLFLDLDRFKLINDSRGHAAGDRVLVEVADRLRETVRPSDTVTRFGGDEFVVVCQGGGSVNAAVDMSRRIAAALTPPVHVGDEEVFITASVGIAVSDDKMSAEALLRDADVAMYRAKEQGRSRCEFFDETMRTEAAARLELQTALHWAIVRDEMRVFYQPIVEVSSGRVTGVEGLVRWAHPELGIVSPADFIPLAEDCGLIIPIGRGVLNQVAQDHAHWWNGSANRSMDVGVNLSAQQLRQPDLVAQVREALDAHGLEPSALILELTETALMEDLDHHIQTLIDLRSLGVRLAIDDFGTGYSSLTYLKRFPVDIVKIDRSFVAGLGRNPSDTAIVRGVIELAHALGFDVVAEGIERPEQLELLRMLGCNLVQGYLFSKPEPPDVLAATLATPPWLTAEWGWPHTTLPSRLAG